MIIRKSPAEIEAMKEAGRVSAKVLREVGAQVRPGVSTLELDELAEALIRAEGGVPAFKGYGGFPGSICASVNEQIVHGIPSRSVVLKEGDIITFMSQDTDSFGETITHKIRKLTTDAEGNPGFITYGTTTDTDDETIVTYPYVLGQYQSHIAGLGTFFNFLKTTPGYFVCIFTPFMLIILYEGIKFFNLFRRYKKEQMEQDRSYRS